MKKIFAEIGFGNDTFLSTEIEEANNEYRIPKLILPKKIDGFYLKINPIDFGIKAADFVLKSFALLFVNFNSGLMLVNLFF